MTYRLSPQAQRDVTLVGDRIAIDNPAAAEALVEAFRKRWRLLALHPLSGRARPDLASDLRQVVIGNYASFYRIEGEDVEILRVMHVRQNVTTKDVEADR